MVGEAVDGEGALRVVDRTPDVVLMDVRMPRLNGLEAAKRLRELAEPPRVLVLTTFDEDEVVDQTMRYGVAGFMLKSSAPEDMVAAVRGPPPARA